MDHVKCQMHKRWVQKRYTMNMRQRQNGWLMVEVVVSLVVLATLAGSLIAITLSAGNGNRMLWARQQALAAVEAQLDCLTQSGLPLPQTEFERLWPRFDWSMEKTSVGPAAGLNRVDITVTGRVNKKVIRVSGRRYIAEWKEQ